MPEEVCLLSRCVVTPRRDGQERAARGMGSPGNTLFPIGVGCWIFQGILRGTQTDEPLPDVAEFGQKTEEELTAIRGFVFAHFCQGVGA